jgi:hypothetical protein
MTVAIPRLESPISHAVAAMRATSLSVTKSAAGRHVSNMFGCDYIHVPRIGIYMDDTGLESIGGGAELVVGDLSINSVNQ